MRRTEFLILSSAKPAATSSSLGSRISQVVCAENHLEKVMEIDLEKKLHFKFSSATPAVIFNSFFGQVIVLLLPVQWSNFTLNLPTTISPLSGCRTRNSVRALMLVTWFSSQSEAVRGLGKSTTIQVDFINLIASCNGRDWKVHAAGCTGAMTIWQQQQPGLQCLPQAQEKSCQETRGGTAASSDPSPL